MRGKPVKIELTLELLKKYIFYNSDTGVFTRIKSLDGRKFQSSLAGSIKKDSRGKPYRRLMVLGYVYPAHRLAWFYMNGKWPKEEIDHHDGNGLNNKFDNLREATHTENQRNQRISDANSTGVTGVSFNKKLGKFTAYITVDKKRTHLGVFSDIETAKNARLKAQNDNNFHPNHGTKRDR